MAKPHEYEWINRSLTDRPRGWERQTLTTQQRAEIRARVAAGERVADLAVEFGVTARTIRRYRT